MRKPNAREMCLTLFKSGKNDLPDDLFEERFEEAWKEAIWQELKEDVVFT